jgi:hypothetical protein
MALTDNEMTEFVSGMPAPQFTELIQGSNGPCFTHCKTTKDKKTLIRKTASKKE